MALDWRSGVRLRWEWGGDLCAIDVGVGTALDCCLNVRLR